jgi:hypothetical protein
MTGSVAAARCAAWTFTLTIALAASGCGGGQNQPAGQTGSAGSDAAPAAPATATMPATSKYDGGPRAGESPVDAALTATGEKLFSTKGCTACHAFGKRLTGPDLQGVTMRRTQQWLEQQILHPEIMTKEDPIARALFAQYALQMPNQGVKPEEAKAIIEFFKQKDKAAGATSAK